MAGKRAAKRSRKPGIPAGSDCSVELGLNGVPVEPQVTENPPPEPAAEVEDGEAEEDEGSQQSEEAEREGEQSDLHSSSKEGSQSEDEEESMEEEEADEPAPALRSPSKGRNGVKKPAPSARVADAKKPPPSGNNKAAESASALQSPSKGKSQREGKKTAPSARVVEAEKSPPPGNKRRNQEPLPSPSPNKRNMVTRSRQTEVPSPSPSKRNMLSRSLQPEVQAPEEHEPEDKGHEPEDQEQHEPEDEGAGIVKNNKKKSKKMRKSAPQAHGPEDEGHEPEDPEEHGPQDEGAGILKGKNKKMRKPAPEEHGPEDQGAEVIKSKKRKSDRIKPAQQQGEPGTSKVKRIRREWAPNDEILILEQVINYRHTHGDAPDVKDSGFFESVLKQLGDQSLELRAVKDKMRSLWRRYFEKKHKSTTEHGKCLDNLSEQAWGKPSQVGAKDSSGRNLSKKALRRNSRKDSNGSKTGDKSFEEMCEMYPLLAQEVELIADIDPSAKSSFTRIDAEVACQLEKQLDAAKAQVSQVRQTLAGELAEAC
ncbi:serine/arginine repetitive matrix protein 1 isoform X1 [Brachypodium distachyon]|uniref:Glabrous enhancer-binding protein-like DBD domain-containing protein n=1 Tax=Brachypodium distachyon TaxID=15368 RepID=I1IVN2_BRADI|nr:serine/arginine repetitive matrix protein 1 isoform X1 [Brachypodium distachyon]KQJ81527.1 hypothetical protein BRADI_5g01257v3 [Brachypodium distachyon]|eukprot:XP_010239627.1 serine/arginine repetitive matrix protein 1 isoform X1 [Brachypodium distachyon]